MTPLWIVVLMKELLEALRDRRTLGMLLMLTLVYPAVIGLILKNMIARGSPDAKAGIELVVIGGGQAPNLLAQLREKKVLVSERGPMMAADIKTLLREKKAAGVLRLGAEFTGYYAELRPAPIELWFDSSIERREQRLEVEKNILRDYANGIAGARLEARGVSPVVLSPLRLERYDTGSDSGASSGRIGTMLGMFFVPVFLFGLSLAIDSTAGERERRSLEVLMAQPMPARDLVLGKWLAVSLLAALGLVVELVVAHGMLSTLSLEEIGMSWHLGLPMLAAVVLTALPLCLLVGAVQVAMAMNSKTFKEAQATASVVTLLPIVPLIAVPMLGLGTQPWMYAVPVLSNQVMLQSLASNQAPGLLPFLLTCVPPLLAACGAAAFAMRRMRSEQYVMGI
ncbi:ABC transporter permease [Massilia sp. Se16.2.3]|nr:ABC transporter permease subunit [Massilia sp. Se16.2.3]QNB00892.1 ABC transporter permease [Massilia sp. Se16.2.3]